MEVRSWGMVGLGWVWVVAFVDTWNGSPSPLKPTPIGYGGAWVGGHEFALAIESLSCHLLACPTPGFKPTPMGSRPDPRPNPSPRGNGLGVLAKPCLNLSPIPHGLRWWEMGGYGCGGGCRERK
ncbi:hypothetical protein Hanom_Chr09g00857621 [Helianthus anomalus]